MATEELTLVVNDTELDTALMRINMATVAKKKVIREAGGQKGITGIHALAQKLPAITRAQRLIITQIPMTREALAMIYRLKMLTGAGLFVGALGLAVYLVRWIQRMQQEMLRERGEYENLIAEGLELTHREWTVLTDLQRGYATWNEQFQAAIREEGFTSAVIGVVTDWFLSLTTTERGELLGELPVERTPGQDDVQ